jgi:hypothetical protein
MGLPLEEERERQEEIFQRFNRYVLGNSSAVVSDVSDDWDGQMAGPNTSETVITGQGYDLIQETESAGGASQIP